VSVSTSVYMCYGIGWDLLYVGCSKQSEARLIQHRYAAAPWVGDVVHTKVRVYPSRTKALAVERRAIRLLRPKHNRQGSRDWIHPLTRHNSERD